MVVPSAGKAGDEPRLGRDRGHAGLERYGDKRVRVGDEQLIPDERHAEGGFQVADQGRPEFGGAVTVRIAKQSDAVRTRHGGAGLLLELLEEIALDPWRS